MPEHADIDDLLRGASASVSADRLDAEFIGTAFRIAPDYAVTAAHVAYSVGERMRLSFGEGSECMAEVVVASEPPKAGSRWGFDDLAVLRIEQPDGLAAPCVLMAEPVLSSGDELLVCALNPSYVDRVIEVYRGYRVRDIHPRFATVDGERSVIRGMSGGPVWSLRHGGVVGFVKASENIDTAQGGAISPLLDGLRKFGRDLYEEIVTSHDAHHRDQQRWADRLVGSEATIRRWLVEAHGWIARISTGAERRVPDDLIEELFRDSLPPDRSRLVTLRDLAEYIGTECQNRNMDLARFCALAPNYLRMDPVVAKGLREMPRNIILPRDFPRFERRFLTAQQHAVTEVTTLFGVILPEEGPRLGNHGKVPHRYELARKYGAQEIISVATSERFSSYDQAKRELKQALDFELSTIDKPHDAVEIVVALPDDRLDEEPLYTWRRADQRPFSKFAMRLRRSCTWEKSSEQIAELQLRWERLRRRETGALVWLGCSDIRARALEGLQVMFTGSEAPDGIGISEPPTAEVLTAAASNALPLTVWRTTSCRTHPGAGCDGTSFRTELTAQLAGAMPTDWYSVIWREQKNHAHGDRHHTTTTDASERDTSPGSTAPGEFWSKILCVVDIPGESRRRPPPLAGPRSL
ncbi:S1 family peptidase [Nocardia donostiensis]|uniref:vWA-MoxR associated protein C-terminal domain-containing protein n=1 Tax=Nocardia donostiensis TaxID=1538463 RepID=A0A1W0AZ82_9NOCA|nr:serine protease [Nocardia donostiensis]ONM48857.1 hypothetical protein B0T46_10285 [Nocardia donostiensis]OQS15521.1 hypothetical protein B0T36_09755 [Nocardia donostiensis]OQS22887.1 hypothetical protein B0T44_04180 [Nocardia donostiensis]